MKFKADELLQTYSIVARDAATGQLGVAVQTHQMGVGRVVPWLLPGVGALATQSMTNVQFGPLGLTMLKEGLPAARVISGLIGLDDRPEVRQVAVVDSQGDAAAWTGQGCIPEAGDHQGEGYSVQANMMTHPTVIQAMSAAFEAPAVDFASRLMAAMSAAQNEGGDIRGMQSAALKIVPGPDAAGKLPHTWEVLFDLRVDEHADPLKELGRLVRLRRAKIIDQRGHDAFARGDRETALESWAEARAMAPELEELAYWQAVTLGDKPADLQAAAAILGPMLASDARAGHWIDLLYRLEKCGLIERTGAASELAATLPS